MAHQRKLIRQAVAALLVSANTGAGARVFPTRIDPLQARELPAIAVYTQDEATDMEMSKQSAPRELTRELDLVIVAFVAHSGAFPADNAMDDIAEQIEAAMDADRWIGGTVAESIYASSENDLVNPDGRSDPLLGIIKLTYSVTYRTSPAVAEQQDLVTIDAKYKIAGSVPSTVPAEDTFTVQESP